MLVLTRCTNETVVIRAGETEIRVLVVDVGDHKVRLGFAAPPDVEIIRPDAKRKTRAER